MESGGESADVLLFLEGKISSATSRSGERAPGGAGGGGAATAVGSTRSDGEPRGAGDFPFCAFAGEKKDFAGAGADDGTGGAGNGV